MPYADREVELLRRKAYDARYRHEHREERRAWADAHRDQRRASGRRYYANHKDQMLEWNRLYRAAHPDRIGVCKRLNEIGLGIREVPSEYVAIHEAYIRAMRRLRERQRPSFTD